MEINVFPEKLRTLWSEWELRVSILVSLLLQLLLIMFGSRRKRDRSLWLTTTMWASYLFADSVAIFALSVLSNMQGESSDDKTSNGTDSKAANNGLIGFWAPFLLLHLGGPDTITAYSLEDNELWRRHLLNLATQVLMAVYAFIRSLSNTQMLPPTTLMFVAGVLKYGERTWALWYASKDHLRDALLDWPKEKAISMDARRKELLRKYSNDIEAGLTDIESCFELLDKYDVHREAGLPAKFFIQSDLDPLPLDDAAGVDVLDPKEMLLAADSFFNTYKRLLFDVMLNSKDRHRSMSFFLTKSANQTYQVVEMELSLFYSVLFTKTVLTHSYWGCCSRATTFLCIVSALSVFIPIRKRDFMQVDVVVTYILLAGALMLEIYSFVLLILSEETMVWLLKRNWTRLWSLLYSCPLRFRKMDRERWSNYMGQYNVIGSCLNKNRFSCLQKLIPFEGINEMLNNYSNTTHIKVSPKLKELIFTQLKNRLVCFGDPIEASKHLCNCRGQWILRRKGYSQQFSWAIEVEFDESVIIWHVATDMCYYKLFKSGNNEDDWNSSRSLSNYLLYLLVQLPDMLPPGIGGNRYDDTCTDIKSTLDIAAPATVASRMIEVLLDDQPTFDPRIRGDTNKSALFNAGKLATQLMELSEKNCLMIIQQVWLELLFYAACHCKGYNHAQRLGSGGELLTHVWLLMAHLGVSEQYGIEAASKKATLSIGK